MSFVISRHNDKKKSNISNEGGSSPMSSQMDDCEIDRDSIVFGDIVKQHEPQKKKQTIRGLIKQRINKVNSNEFIKLSLDEKKCKNLFEEEKLYEFSQRSLNPTQYRIFKKNKQQNSSTSPQQQKKHHSNKVMPQALLTVGQNNNQNNESNIQSNITLQQRNSNSQQKNQGVQVSPFVAASFVQLQQSENHVTLLDKLSIDSVLYRDNIL